jgi:phosphatidylserine/phosphatidylglycerophosphate/cardiolipin synthase-like enzyme
VASAGSALNRYTAGNAVTLLRSGFEYFPALMEAIEGAEHEIWIETYIFADDDTGREVAHALVAAAKRGVRVRVLVDGWGARHYLTRSLERRLIAGGVDLLKYRPEVHPWHFRSHRLRRLHRKLCQIDRSIAFVGGINVIDDMNTPGHTPPRVEYRLLHYASRALYGQLLSAGIGIQEYDRSFLHAKVAVVDSQWATVGSSNIDPYSFLMSREANVFVRDTGFASELRVELEGMIDNGARPVPPQDWKNRSRFAKAVSWIAYGIVRVAMGMLRYGGDEWWRSGWPRK